MRFPPFTTSLSAHFPMVESSAKHSSDLDNCSDGVVSHMNKNPLKFHPQKISLELTCPLCLGFFNRLTLLPCNHIFYNTCVPNRTNFGAECPLCNIQVPGQALIRTNLHIQ